MPAWLIALIAVAAVGLVAFVWLRARAPSDRANGERRLDTVAAWSPTATRILTSAERQAFSTLERALPGHIILAQVPLARFLRVPTRHSHREWMQRVGSLSADLVMCNAGSKVLAVIDIRSAEQTGRARRRHERMAKVLRAAGISVHTWTEGDLPSAAEIRTLLGAELQRRINPAAAAKATPSRPMPLIPVAEIEELLAHGDQAALDMTLEPVPSAFFEDSELSPQP